ncbi:hypothetical protein HYX17_04290 [Candidatus Woesearchaeota archaeon]|nr:hypothetical protein [Candidatus Woesearchaeota archaeon]
MALTSVDLIALIFVVIALIKLIVLVFNKKGWYNSIAKPVYSNPMLSELFLLIVGAALFYFISQELTVVQIFAAVGLAAVLFAIAFLQYSHEFMTFMREVYDQEFNRIQWLHLIAWLAILAWVFYEILLRL